MCHPTARCDFPSRQRPCSAALLRVCALLVLLSWAGGTCCCFCLSLTLFSKISLPQSFSGATKLRFCCWEGNTLPGKKPFSLADVGAQVLELTPLAAASRSKFMMLCSPRSRGACLKKGEACWQDSGTRAALLALFLKPPK